MIKLGIIGSNFVSDWLCESVERTEGICCHAVYSRTLERGKEFADKYHIGKVYTDMAEFLSSDIDAVYIASPNKLHYPQAMAAIAHGKHVLCEKPIALNVTELTDMVNAAHKNNVILLEAMRPAFDPALTAIKEALPKLGELRYARFEFCQYSSRYDRFKKGEILNAFNPQMGNAAVMDLGVYAIHSLVKLLGQPDMDSIHAKSVKLSNGFEGMGTVLLSYGSFQAEVLYSKLSDSLQPSIIMGENGSLSIGKLSVPEKVFLHLRGCEPEEITFETRENNMEFEVQEFVRLINTKEVDHPHMKYSVLTLEIMDQIRNQNQIAFD